MGIAERRNRPGPAQTRLEGDWRCRCRLAVDLAKRLGVRAACPHPYPQEFGLDTSVGIGRALRRRRPKLRLGHRNTKAAHIGQWPITARHGRLPAVPEGQHDPSPAFQRGDPATVLAASPGGTAEAGGAAKSLAPVSVVPNGTPKGIVSRADPALKRWAGITTSLAGRRSGRAHGSAGFMPGLPAWTQAQSSLLQPNAMLSSHAFCG